MSIEDQYSYYSRHFDIICKEDSKYIPPVYSLTVIMASGDIGENITELTEPQLKTTYEQLKNRTYANI